VKDPGDRNFIIKTTKPVVGMNQYSHLNHTSLLDLLAKHTAEYTQMLADNDRSYEFYKCRRTVEKLTEELESRMRETPHDTPHTADNGNESNDSTKTVSNA
jgi:hypothetical protein